MATFRKRSGNWQAIVRKKGYPEQTATFDTKDEAQTWAHNTESHMKRGVFVSTTKAEQTTLKEIIQRYIVEIEPQKKGAEQEIYKLEKMAKLPLSQRYASTLRTADFSKYRDERLKTVKPATVVRELAVFHSIFEVARKEWDINIPNPVSDIRRPKLPKGRDRRLLEGEEEILLEACGNSGNIWLKQVVIFAIETAMRKSEIFSLNWDDINIKKRTAHLTDTKNNESRTVPLSNRAINLLKSLPQSEDNKVFTTTINAFSLAWKRMIKKTELKDLRFHDLRHEATSRFFEMGLEIMEVASITGHKDLRMLTRYTHMSAEKLAKKLN